MPLGRADLSLRPPTWIRGPDGMQQADWPTWFAWQHAHHHEYQAFAFNVRLAATKAPNLDRADPTARAFYDSLARRVDAVGLLPDGRVDLIEVATVPSPSAIGQLLIYDQLWRQQSPMHRAALILVCRELDPDLGAVLPPLGIRADVIA